MNTVCPVPLRFHFLCGIVSLVVACHTANPGEPADSSTSGADSGTEASAEDIAARCSATGLTWKSGFKTEYESYPDPGSAECIEFNGCAYLGMFAACSEKRSEEWVKTHNIVAVFPDFGDLALHDICVKYNDKYFIATVYDTCGDSDCNGCCTQNKGDADQLIDFEKYTGQRFGIPQNAKVQWADLGPTVGAGCK